MSITKKIIFLLLLFCFSFSLGKSLATTRFEKFWFSKINKMKFREPFTFMPINLKIGYFQYGGDDYLKQWDDVFSGDEIYDSNPILFEDEVDWWSVNGTIEYSGMDFDILISRLNPSRTFPIELLCKDDSNNALAYLFI